MNIFIFAGTSEGRELACYLSEHGLSCTVSVATEYGGRLLPFRSGISVLQGRMTASDMRKAFAEKDYRCVVDATHPFAQSVSEEIALACKEEGLFCLRLSRRTTAEESSGESAATAPAIVYFDTLSQAAAWLEGQKGNILVTTGSKGLPELTERITEPERLYVRVLPSVESIKQCTDCGIAGSHIIAMQGPFSAEMNALLLRESHASFLLSKETGLAGGLGEKLAAAEQCRLTAVLIRNPERNDNARTGHGYSFSEVLARLEELTGLSLRVPKRQIVLAGVGPASPKLLTEEVRQALARTDVIFAAPRVLEGLSRFATAACVPYYRYSQIAAYLEAHPSYNSPLVAFSGDSGFYSGAESFLRQAREDGNSALSCTICCGVSSLSYFAARIGRSWQDWTLLSSHGRSCPVVETLRTQSPCFLLLSGTADVHNLGAQLEKAMRSGLLGNVRVTLARQLACPDEQISQLSPAELAAVEGEGLYVMLLEHDAATEASLVPGLDDDAFVRAAVPITKRELRTLVLSRLQLTSHAILYDIGSGTGSVTVEAARICRQGKVFALDCRKEAVALTKENAERFCLQNVEVLHATAPEGLEPLPPPTHVFIGGSKGQLSAIIAAVLKKNPRARIVLTAVTVETLAAAQKALADLPVSNVDYLLVSVSRAEQVGGYHLFKAQNPVYIISCTGAAEA